MKHGNWIPISKALIKHLPKSREYTKLEACISVQFDYDCKNKITVAGYSALWMWSRKKVSKFLEDIGVEIIYPESTQKKQNQKGQIGLQIRDRSGTDKAQIRCIENTYLQEQKDRSGTDEEQIKSRSGSTTIKPITLNPNPNPKDKELSCEFEDFWNAFKKKQDKDKCSKKWKKLTQKEKDSIFQCVSSYVQSTPDPQFRKNPLTWLNGKCWNDEIVPAKTTGMKKNGFGEEGYYQPSSTGDKNEHF